MSQFLSVGNSLIAALGTVGAFWVVNFKYTQVVSAFPATAEQMHIQIQCAQDGRTIEHDGYRIEAVTYQSDNGLMIPAFLCGSGSKLAIYLDPRGKTNAIHPGGDVSELVKLGFTVFAIDVSGIGEVEFRRHDGTPWGFPQLVSLGLMVGRPLVGIRINDVIRGLDALDALGKDPVGGSGVMGFAQGKLGTVLLHAAVMDDRLSGVAVEQSLLSYRLVGASPIHRDLEDTMIPGVLGRYDLPDLAAALAPRPVSILNSVSPTGRVLLRKDMSAEYRYASEAYATTGAAGQFRIGLRREGEALAQAHSLR